MFAEIWKAQRGSQLVQPRDNEHRLSTIGAFIVPGRGAQAFGDLPLDQIRTGDIEAFQDARRAKGLSAYTVNDDLKLLRKMFNWGIRKGYLERTPFKIGTEPAIKLDKEIPRDRRFQAEDDEQRLLNAAEPHLRAVVVALLDTACRLGGTALPSMARREPRAARGDAPGGEHENARSPNAADLVAPARDPRKSQARCGGRTLGSGRLGVWHDDRRTSEVSTRGVDRSARQGRARGSATARSAARGGFSLRRGRRVHELREQDSWAQEPEHHDPISQHPTTWAPSRDGEARREPADGGRGPHEESRRATGSRCTTVAHGRKIRTSLCAGFTTYQFS
jgi:hypothetical protein